MCYFKTKGRFGSGRRGGEELYSEIAGGFVLCKLSGEKKKLLFFDAILLLFFIVAHPTHRSAKGGGGEEREKGRVHWPLLNN